MISALSFKVKVDPLAFLCISFPDLNTVDRFRGKVSLLGSVRVFGHFHLNSEVSQSDPEAYSSSECSTYLHEPV